MITKRRIAYLPVMGGLTVLYLFGALANFANNSPIWAVLNSALAVIFFVKAYWRVGSLYGDVKMLENGLTESKTEPATPSSSHPRGEWHDSAPSVIQGEIVQ